MPESCFHYNPLFLPTFPKCRLQHLKTVALDIFVGREAPVERQCLGAWGGLKVTRVQTTAEADIISRQNIFPSSPVVLCHTLPGWETFLSDAFIGKLNPITQSFGSNVQREKCGLSSL